MIIIHSTPRFEVRSFNNGAAYALIQLCPRRAIAWQYGDDATTFRNELKSWEKHNPDLDMDTILANIWADYEHLAVSD